MQRRVGRMFLALAVAAVVGVAGAGISYGAFSSRTSTPSNSFSLAPDWVAPTADVTLAAQTAGGADYRSTVLADGPLGWWRLGESSGTTAADSSGNGRSGSYLGGYTLGAGGAINSVDTATAFNGSDARVEITSSAFQLATSLSVEAWVYPTASNGSYGIFDKTIGGGTNTSYLMFTSGSHWKCRLIKSGTQYEVASHSAPAAGSWSHVACTWDGTTIRLYVNGVEDDSTALSGSIATGSGVNVIGRLGGGSYPLNGSVDEVAVYSQALSAARVQAHYDAISGGLTDAVRQCEPYYTFAHVTDTGNPASGIASVQADLSPLTAGQTAAGLSSGSFTVGSTGYNYRAGPFIADAAPGSPSYSLTLTDAAANSRQQTGLAATVLAQATTPPTPVLLTGIEQGVASPTNPGVFASVTGAVGADAAVHRNGSYSLQVAAANAAANALFTPSTATATDVLRFALRLASVPSQTVTLFTLVPNGGNALNLVYDSATGRLGVRWGAGTITASTVTPTAGTWYRIELNANLANPHTLDWRIDGTDQTQSTSAEGARTVTSLRFGTAATTETYTANYDDVLFSQTAADYPLGDGKVLALVPDGVGTHSGATNFRNDDASNVDANSWSRLGDIPATSTSDYVKQIANSTSSYIELTFQDTTAACINGVGARLAYNAANTGAKGKTSIFDGATETIVLNGTMSPTTLNYARALVTPTATPWTQTTVNGLKARIGYSSQTNPNPYWQALMLEYDVRTA